MANQNAKRRKAIQERQDKRAKDGTLTLIRNTIQSPVWVLREFEAGQDRSFFYDPVCSTTGDVIKETSVLTCLNTQTGERIVLRIRVKVPSFARIWLVKNDDYGWFSFALSSFRFQPQPRSLTIIATTAQQQPQQQPQPPQRSSVSSPGIFFFFLMLYLFILF